MADQPCAACGAANRPGVKFCVDCGTPMAATCPTCGAPAATGRFCGECGTPLTAAVDREATGAAPAATAPAAEPAEAPDRPAAAPVSERRIVSLLFADLVGFTPLSESRDPE